ncbi:NAD(P)H-hydrate dehydratase [Pelagicoccus sp. NFK12]|uniref:ADP-dependent (S)-NAD(P)H-hydrate dehydratase n=1 Tax=Pelagicoccus enzymogenes TaxID=2773457 RepID=A0A927IK46_9BACT|nr:NAD(P)H-hydrate dehydratase [Pelagicoccus enzymogenes]MBD5782519.1 NAD(P)H-hydrate dehydratase [Pelagicoccus enzymogenes]
MASHFFHPVLSCRDSLALEERLLIGEEASWEAMNRAGTALGLALLKAYSMTGFPQNGLRLLGLIGKGHNGGDALLAFCEMARLPGRVEEATLLIPTSRGDLKPHTLRAFKMLEGLCKLRIVERPNEGRLQDVLSDSYDIALDGLLGMQFRPPLRNGVRRVIDAVNASDTIRFRSAVDLPSGVGDESDETPFQADVTFATGIFKEPLLTSSAVGMARYLDIGFFDTSESVASQSVVVTDSILDRLRAPRPAASEKRQFGHLAILAGSRSMPGALAMSVKAALQSGVGLVTVFAPESIVSQLACQLPEAMWRTWPETPEGGLALEGLWQVKAMAGKASALLLGPGMGSEAETLALMGDVGKVWDAPAVLDADALRPEVVRAFRESGNTDIVVSPHDGEFMRLSGCSSSLDTEVSAYAKAQGVVVVKKGPNTRILDGSTLCVNSSGNAVLARGGSGDILAGLIAGLLAQGACPTLECACRAVYWHGKAADLLAVDRGQVAVRTTDLLGYLGRALRTKG